MASPTNAMKPWKTDEQAKAEAEAGKVGMLVAMAKRKMDYEDVLRNLPVQDAKRDGLIFVIADLNKHLARLGADPGREGGERV